MEQKQQVIERLVEDR